MAHYERKIIKWYCIVGNNWPTGRPWLNRWSVRRSYVLPFRKLYNTAWGITLNSLDKFQNNFLNFQADREKDAQKRREEEEKEEQDRIAAAQRHSEEQERLKAEAEKERKRKEIEKRLPKEPPASVDHAKIRFRVVGGNNNLERRFLPGDTLQVVFDYLAVEGFPVEDHKVLSSWPRRDVSI